MAPTEKYELRELPRVQCGLGLGIGTTARAGVASVAGALSLCEGSGCQLGFIAQYPPPVTNGRLALVNAVIVLTVPMDDVAFVRHVAPTGISCLIGAASSFAKA